MDAIIEDSIDYSPFKWGVNDCCAHAAKILVNCGAPNFYEDFDVKSESDAKKALLSMGCENLYDLMLMIAAKHKWSEVPYKQSQSADVAIFKQADDFVVGVVKGGFVLAKTAKGIAGIPVENALIIWRVL